MRWSLIISKKQHATNSDTVNIVYIAGDCEGADESPSRMQITNSDLEDAVSEIIRKLVNNPRFSEVMKTKINTSVDTSEAEKELANAKKV